LGKQSLLQANFPIFIEAILPDIPIFLFYGWAKLIARQSEKQICQNLTTLIPQILKEI
jgi:hypothetical protein